MPPQLWNVSFQPDTPEQCGNFGAQASGRTVALAFDCVAKNLPHFLFHAAAVAACAMLQALLHFIFDIANDELSHKRFYDITLEYVPILRQF